MTLNGWVKRCHDIAVSKGWWEEPVRRDGELIALMHSELSEALEAIRNSDRDPRNVRDGMWYDRDKPEGVSVELVDCIIRIMDCFGRKGWDMEKVLKAKCDYNEKRPYRHGGKRL
jgi:hypothetical protein